MMEKMLEYDREIVNHSIFMYIGVNQDTDIQGLNLKFDLLSTLANVVLSYSRLLFQLKQAPPSCFPV